MSYTIFNNTDNTGIAIYKVTNNISQNIDNAPFYGFNSEGSNKTELVFSDLRFLEEDLMVDKAVKFQHIESRYEEKKFVLYLLREEAGLIRFNKVNQYLNIPYNADLEYVELKVQSIEIEASKYLEVIAIQQDI
jgi:hypothetical protein